MNKAAAVATWDTSKEARNALRRGGHTLKPKTRDNLIYLAVGIVAVVAITVPMFIADSRGREMRVSPNINFWFRVISSPLVVCYFQLREGTRLRVKRIELTGWVLVSIIMYLGVAFGFRDVVNSLSGIAYTAILAAATWLSVVVMGRLLLRKRNQKSRNSET